MRITCECCEGEGWLTCEVCEGEGRVAAGVGMPAEVDCPDCTQGMYRCEECAGEGDVVTECEECHRVASEERLCPSCGAQEYSGPERSNEEWR